MTLRILLADDHELILAAIRRLVESMEGMQVVAQACDGREAVTLARIHRPDLAIMDISMRELNGIEATGQIRDVSPGTRVLILSSHTTADFVRRSLKAGASGYLSKDSAPQELGTAIEAISKGEVFVSSRVAHHLVAGLRGDGKGDEASPLEVLTMRQREILQMIAEGKTTKEIAHGLFLSTKTVETHRAAIMERLNIRNVSGLAIFALRSGLIGADPA